MSQTNDLTILANCIIEELDKRIGVAYTEIVLNSANKCLHWRDIPLLVSVRFVVYDSICDHDLSWPLSVIVYLIDHCKAMIFGYSSDEDEANDGGILVNFDLTEPNAVEKLVQSILGYCVPERIKPIPIQLITKQH